MARIVSNDELNILQTYFNEMEISQDEKKERVDFAAFLFLAFSNLFDLIRLKPDIDRDIVRDFALKEYREAVKYGGLNNEYPFYDERAEECVDEVLATTYEKQDSSYTYSDSRKRKIVETETNVLYNYRDFQKAKADGKTMKTWITMRDERVRLSHFYADNVAIPIDELFTVGSSLMAFPGDTSHGASADEIINCRCSIKYS